MNFKDGFTCSACGKQILENDLVAWTGNNNFVHLICDTIQIREGVKFMGRAKNLKEQIALHENIA
ncbi:hypothetical protein [Domibacillus mangrovi]|uniref:Uncharacterized protein n=1 Tax=Domibacillus mangrovi TaxID=1714354 RepID=A0A1Q5NZF5_9BACI|nr:hypothetical protein [Domibacillus mangrovi]OKL35316.1 hypothetical protein BLL40_16035 [Domibacillus mangrovi]